MHALEPHPPQRIFAAESAATASASMLRAPCLPGLAMLPDMPSKVRSLPYLSIHCLSILSFQPHSQAPCNACQFCQLRCEQEWHHNLRWYPHSSTTSSCVSYCLLAH